MQAIPEEQLDVRIKQFIARQTSKLPQKELQAEWDRREQRPPQVFGLGSKYVW